MAGTAGLMNLSTLGILPRLGLALVPWLTGELVDSWFPGCFFSESPFCIYFWHAPGMDLAFALLVLAPFMSAQSLLAFRLLALLILSVIVHALSIGFLVATRGSLEVPGLDSIFVNIIPIAMVASVVTVSGTALACGLRLTRRLLLYSLLAAIPAAFVFILVDVALSSGWLRMSFSWNWAVWHLSICCAIYYGRLPTVEKSPA